MFLVEKLPSETPRDVGAFLEVLILEVYGGRPDWLEYDLRDRYAFRGREFIQMFCPAGSVQAHLIRRASTRDGISRDLLQLGRKDGRPLAWLLHLGQESEHDPGEVQMIGQQISPPEPPPAASNSDTLDYQTLDSLPAPSSGGGR